MSTGTDRLTEYRRKRNFTRTREPKGGGRKRSAKLAYVIEGTIPKGEYGGGTVMVWDLGSYTAPQPKRMTLRQRCAKATARAT